MGKLSKMILNESIKATVVTSVKKASSSIFNLFKDDIHDIFFAKSKNISQLKINIVNSNKTSNQDYRWDIESIFKSVMAGLDDIGQYAQNLTQSQILIYYVFDTYKNILNKYDVKDLPTIEFDKDKLYRTVDLKSNGFRYSGIISKDCTISISFDKLNLTNNISAEYIKYYSHKRNLVITYIGKGAKRESENFVKNCKAFIKDINENKIIVKRLDYIQLGLNPENESRVNTELFSTTIKEIDAIINPNVSKIKEIIQGHFNDSAFYDKNNIRKTLRILLYGVPGTGKTSISQAISSECITHYNIENCISVKLATLNAGEMSYIISNGNNTVFHLDEIDTITNREDESLSNTKDIKDSKMRLNFILDLLDGSNTPDNSVFVATTNYVDKLDPALHRRFDYIINIDNIPKEYAIRLCTELDSSIDPEEVLKTPGIIDENGNYNPDKVQKALIKIHRQKAKEELLKNI